MRAVATGEGPQAGPRGGHGEARMDVKIKINLEFSVSENGLEDAMAEYDELTVEGLLREILDKSIACDDIRVKVVEGPNTLEEYDQRQADSPGS